MKARPALAAGAADPKADEAEELRQLLALSPEDLEFLDRVRGDAHRLALALQLVWTRAERVLATDPASLPAPVIATVAAQLGVDPDVLGAYRAWPTTRAADNVAVCEHLGVRPFDVDEDGARLGQVLREKVAHTGSTAALLDAAEDWLVRQGLLRPTGESTIERLLYSARAAAEEELFAFMAGQLTQSQGHGLDELCRTNGQDSEVAQLSVPSRVPSARAVADDCERLERIRAVLPPAMDWGSITANRRRQWAAVVRRQTAQALRRYKPPKRRTLLLAFLVVRCEEITDAVVEMFDALIGRTFARSQAALIESRLDQAQAQTEGVRMLRTIAEVLLDPAIAPEAVRSEIFRRVPRERVSAAVEQAAALDTSQAEAFFGELAERYPYIRSFAPLVLRTLSFASARAGNEVLEALEVLAGMNAERRLNVPADAPLGVVPRKWKRVVLSPEGVDRRVWEFSVLSEARAALRAGDLTVGGSRRFTPWDGNLYTPAAWEGRRSSWLAEAGLPASGEEYAAEHGLASRLLSAIGVDLERSRAAVRNLLGEAPPASDTDLRPTERTKQVLEFARQEASSLHSTHVRSEHLLLGLAREGGGLGARILADLGVGYQHFRGRVDRVALVCSFCGRSGLDVAHLVAGPGVYICERCTEAASRLDARAPLSLVPENRPASCSFCGKQRAEVERLISGGSEAVICEDCLVICREIQEEQGQAFIPGRG